MLLVSFYLGLSFDPIKGVAKQEPINLIDGLSYEVIYPENQKNKDLGYFDLQMSPGQEQKISLKLYNSLPKELTVEVRLNTAKTNSIGKVEYGPNESQEDSSLTNNFIEVVKGPKKVVIPPKGAKEVDLEISLPKEAVNGLIAGGIQIKPVVNSSVKEQSKKDVVVNEFAFLVGVLLRVGDTSNIKPELKLNKTYIAFKESKSHLFINISNIHPVYVEGMDIAVQLRKSNKQKVLFEYQKKGMRMAPNSMIDLPVDLSDKGMTAGDYSVQINVVSKNGGKWSWTEDFKINALEANGLNTQLVENKTGNKLIFLIYFLMVCIGILVFILSYKAIKRKRMKPEKRK